MAVFLMSFTQVTFAQITISGKVTDESGELLPGASVIIKGTSVGTVTDFDGFYTLTTDDKEGVLVYSYIGYASYKEAINNRTTINVSLKPNTQSLDEVVIVGYGAEKKSQITGAVASISTESLAKNTAASLDNALQGKVAGVSVATNSATPGGGISVRIRGVGGVNGSEPLYVIDGMPISVSENESSSPLSSINPQDIKSMTILKDAASAAIYGARAANGVVLITTNRGRKNQKATVKISTKFGVQSMAEKNDMMDAETYANYINLINTNSGKPIVFNDPSSFGKGTDWVDAVTRVASVSDLQVSFSGGDETGNYFLSLGHYKQNGIVKSTSFERISVTINGDRNISDKFKIGSSISLTRSKQNAFNNARETNNSPFSLATTFYPTLPVYDENGNYAPTEGPYKPVANPLFSLDTKLYPPIVSTLRANLFAEYKILPNLDFKTSGFYTFNNTVSENIGRVYDMGNAVSTEQAMSKSQATGSTSLIENTLMYRLNSIDNHNISVLLGQSAQSRKRETLRATGEYPTEGHYVIDSQANSLTVRNVINEESLLSFFGKVNYSFKDKYLMTAILRRDGSSKFGANERWGTFPSVSLGWNITEEDFMPKESKLNLLKFRTGWGQVGYDGIPNYSYAAVVSQNYNYPFGNQGGVRATGSAINGIPNPDVKWETVTQFSIGVDAEMFDERLSLVAEYYNKTQDDMLLPVSQSGVTGLSDGTNPGFIFLNTGKLVNDGFEFSANYGDKIGKLSFNVGANVTTLNNVVKSIPSPIEAFKLKGGFLTRTVQGRSLGEFYGFVANGIFQSQAEVDAHATQNGNTAPGDIRFRDLNNDGIVDDSDKTFIGSPIPEFTYGFSVNLNYENFDFSLQGNGTSGNDIYNATKMELIDNTRSENKMNFTPWSSENSDSKYPRAFATDPNTNLRNSSYFVENGSFLRVKNIQLGYSIPSEILTKLKMSHVRFYTSVQNPFTITKYSGVDPEVGNAGGNNLSAGIDHIVYPLARVYSIGLNARF